MSRLTASVSVASVDDLMLQIRPLPKDFEKWLDDVVYRENRYMLYQYTRKKEADGYCTHCGQHVKVSGAKHRAEGRCPSCKSPVTYLVSGRTDEFTINKKSGVYPDGEGRRADIQNI